MSPHFWAGQREELLLTDSGNAGEGKRPGKYWGWKPDAHTAGNTQRGHQARRTALEKPLAMMAEKDPGAPVDQDHNIDLFINKYLLSTYYMVKKREKEREREKTRQS